jgi:hypothetical protein
VQTLLIPAEAARGWRLWSLVPAHPETAGDWRLTSPHRFAPWHPLEPLRASCADCLSPPSVDCSCGIRGYSAGRFVDDIPSRFGEPGSFSAPFASARMVARCIVGEVAGWGNLFPSSVGWRAEFAYPLSVALVCIGCLVTRARLEPAVWVCSSPAGRHWATCDPHTREYLNMPSSMRRTSPAGDVEEELRKRYRATPADPPVWQTRRLS